MRLVKKFSCANKITRNTVSSSQERDIAWIKSAIMDTEKGINTKAPQHILKYYSRAIILSFPNIPDRTGHFSKPRTVGCNYMAGSIIQTVKMRTSLLLILLASSLTVFAQRIDVVYRSKGDTLQNYYKALIPDTTSKGLLVIIGGFCTPPDEVMRQTQLPDKAVKAGYTVVIPYLLDDCSTIDTKNLYQSRLETLIPELTKRYNTPKDKFIIGGQSFGGHRALYYAEQSFKVNNPNIIKPNLVFGVDPPLNMKRLWNEFAYGVRINFSEASVGEGTEMMRRFKIIYGGNPSQNQKKYEEASSFYPEAKDGGNAKYLKNLPVRLYCDPDINWIIENRRGSYETMNATDLAGCISQLKLLGNNDAEFINCLGKGFKPDGTRHPHYFSMLDPDEFIEWANKMLYNE
jgi:hypothetical protein